MRLLLGLSLIVPATVIAALDHPSGAVAADLSGEVLLHAEYPNKYPGRNYWDIAAALDLSHHRGVEFDFKCDDPGQFSGFCLYFKSGNGWYLKGFEYDGNGAWRHIVLDKTAAGRCDRPHGWSSISTVRVCAWRFGHKPAHLGIARLKPCGEDFCDVLVVRGDTHIRKAPNLKDAVYGFVRNVKETLDAVGADSAVVSDTNLDAIELVTAKVVILPGGCTYHENVTPLLKNFVSDGGKVIGCYGSGADALDVKIVNYVPSGAGGRPKIAGFLKTVNGLPEQPPFVTQHSGFTTKAALPAGSRIIAEWGDADRKSVGLPAIAIVPNGAYFEHVWQGGVDMDHCALMRSILLELMPTKKHCLEKRREEYQTRTRTFDAWVDSRKSKPGEFRAYWCHSPKGLRGYDWDATLRMLKESGFNAILANLSWGGTAFYGTKVLETHKDLATDGDMLEKCLAASRKYGIACHAWRVCFNCGSAASKTFLERARSEGRLVVDFNGKSIGNWLCPSNPENKRQEVRAILEMAAKGVDGVHIDYIRYPGPHACFCSGCRTRFEKRIGRTVATWPDDVRKDAELANAWKEFRCSHIADVVRESAKRVHAHYPGVAFSAAVGADGEKTPDDNAQDWYDWCKKGYLDFVCPMTYTDSTQNFWARTRSEREILGDFKIRPGIGISCWLNDGEDIRKSIEQIEAVRKEGLDGFVLFALDDRGIGALPALRRGITRD